MGRTSKVQMDACYFCVNLGLDYQRIHACPNDCMLYIGQKIKRKITAKLVVFQGK